MKNQSHEVFYHAAMDAATTELDGLFGDARHLRNRREQINAVINALKELLEPSQPNGADKQCDSTLSVVVA